MPLFGAADAFASRVVLLAALLLGVCGGSARADQADAYLLGPMDVLRLRVSEWRSSDETFRDWSSVSGDYAVGASGAVAIPFVGNIQAGGRTTEELGKLVSNSLQARFGLADQPDAVFEVNKYRPFYVFGDVTTPGALSYAPGLSVVKAIAMAGGQRRGATPEMRVEREMISAQGDLDTAMMERHRLAMRRARIQAEVDGRAELEMPKELASVPEARAFLEDERVIMIADRERLALQLQALNELKTLLQGEVQSLDGRRQSIQRQIDLTRRELSGANSLANRGLALNARLSELERRIADYEERGLEVDTAVLRARQDISKAEQDVIKLENDRRSELAVQRQEVDAQLDALVIKSRAQTGLLDEAQRFAPDAIGGSSKGSYSYSLMRVVDGRTAEFAAGEDAEVLPGDVVKVKYNPPASAF